MNKIKIDLNWLLALKCWQQKKIYIYIFSLKTKETNSSSIHTTHVRNNNNNNRLFTHQSTDVDFNYLSIYSLLLLFHCFVHSIFFFFAIWCVMCVNSFCFGISVTFWIEKKTENNNNARHIGKLMEKWWYTYKKVKLATTTTKIK